MFSKQNFVFILLFKILIMMAYSQETSYKFCRILPFGSRDLKAAKELEKSNKGYIFLNEIQEERIPVYVLVPTIRIDEFHRKIQSILVKCQELKGNKIDPNSMLLNVANPNRKDDSYKWTEYHKLEDTYNWLKSLQIKYHKKLSVVEVGKSSTDGLILGVKISYRSGNKAIFIDGGSHGQNWISSATVNYIINQLLTTKDTSLRSIIENYDWYLVPHTNPDGYNYTHYKNRFWSKTIAKQDSCFGVDFNRNWDFLYNEEEVTRYPCNKLYPGLHPFSEKETETIRDYLTNLDEILFFYLSIDAPDNRIYLPNNKDKLWNYKSLKLISEAAINGIEKKFGQTYKKTDKGMQPKSGTSVDWVYENLQVNYAFTFHLPPAYDFDGFEFLDAKFLMPSSKIISIGEQIFYGLMEMLKETEGNNRKIANSNSPYNRDSEYFEDSKLQLL